MQSVVQQGGKDAWIEGRRHAHVYMGVWISCHGEEGIDECID